MILIYLVIIYLSIDFSYNSKKVEKKRQFLLFYKTSTKTPKFQDF